MNSCLDKNVETIDKKKNRRNKLREWQKIILSHPVMRNYLKKSTQLLRSKEMSDLGKLLKGLIVAVIVLTIFAYLGVYIISLVI